MQPFLNEGRILFTDNFYTSPSLAEHPSDNNTHLCKTVQTNCRNYCSEITQVNLDKGQSVFFESTNHPECIKRQSIESAKSCLLAIAQILFTPAKTTKIETA